MLKNYLQTMKIKIYYRKSLSLSEGKLAAQVGHVVRNLAIIHGSYVASKCDRIVVLHASDTKYNKLLTDIESKCKIYRQIDKGYTEVPDGTETCFGYVEFED
jgi:peptidyl-tRNA hydrolase